MPSMMRLINIISRCGAIWRADKLRGTDLGDAHHSYILTLCKDPGISQDSLSRRLFINKSNVTRTLSYLEKQGYVTRKQSDEDRRIILVYPTEKAYAALPEVRDIVHGWNEYVTQDLTPEESAQLAEILPKMAARAAEYAKLSEEALGDGGAEEKKPEKCVAEQENTEK